MSDALVFWADVVVMATLIRWGNASSLYYKMIERMNSRQKIRVRSVFHPWQFLHHASKAWTGVHPRLCFFSGHSSRRLTMLFAKSAR